ncbi:unnamed protein product [Protopolystoma xenopodis]|uniref:Uncharacterized protein n=1 Tax=Protopolystoma xenopodis TaxID=117903 RepID=A0A3S5C7U1_9PLAT|nr:unnamed protein product [Protopolystoma xenopodis]
MTTTMADDSGLGAFLKMYQVHCQMLGIMTTTMADDFGLQVHCQMLGIMTTTMADDFGLDITRDSSLSEDEGYCFGSEPPYSHHPVQARQTSGLQTAPHDVYRIRTWRGISADRGAYSQPRQPYPPYQYQQYPQLYYGPGATATYEHRGPRPPAAEGPEARLPADALGYGQWRPSERAPGQRSTSSQAQTSWMRPLPPTHGSGYRGPVKLGQARQPFGGNPPFMHSAFSFVYSLRP